MQAATSDSPRRIFITGSLIVLLVGVVAASVVGYVYFLIARKVGIDLWLLMPALFGILTGAVVGHAANRAEMYVPLVAATIAFISGAASFGARYYFQYRDDIETAVQSHATQAASFDQVESELLDWLAQEYPPGGYLGYLQFAGAEGVYLISPSKNQVGYVFLGLGFVLSGLMASLVANKSVRDA